MKIPVVDIGGTDVKVLTTGHNSTCISLGPARRPGCTPLCDSTLEFQNRLSRMAFQVLPNRPLSSGILLAS
jgi:hypothetical protein